SHDQFLAYRDAPAEDLAVRSRETPRHGRLCPWPRQLGGVFRGGARQNGKELARVDSAQALLPNFPVRRLKGKPLAKLLTEKVGLVTVNPRKAGEEKRRLGTRHPGRAREGIGGIRVPVWRGFFQDVCEARQVRGVVRDNQGILARECHARRENEGALV